MPHPQIESLGDLGHFLDKMSDILPTFVMNNVPVTHVAETQDHSS